MKTAFLFSGQGAQYPGMMLDVVDAYSEAREVFHVAKEVLGRDLYTEIGQMSQNELDQTLNTQPCMLVCELAVLRVLRAQGIPYDAVAGFSLGEWAAVVAADVLQESDAIRMIACRAEAMQRAVPIGKGGMAYMLGKDDRFVAHFCEEVGGVAPANYNIQGNVSVAGTAEGIECFLERGEREGLLVGRIPVSIPSHCWLMKSAVEELTPLIRTLEMKPSQMPLLMNATGRKAAGLTEIKNNLAMQLTHPVQFRQIVDTLLLEGFDAFIEAGPGNTLSKMIKKAAKQRGCTVCIMQAGRLEDIEKIKVTYGL